MANIPLRLSEHPSSLKWLSQFDNASDRALAAQLLNQIKLVSGRDFELKIEQELEELQRKLGERIAVYPIAPPLPEEVAGYDPFNGAIPKVAGSKDRNIGRRRKYGSEDRVGHFLAKLQERFSSRKGISAIECAPTLLHLKAQKIRHIVLIDDVCGSGIRIQKYWNAMPRRVKSLLSLKKLDLWLVLYTITPVGEATIKKRLKSFPFGSRLISVLPARSLASILSSDVVELCKRYAERLDLDEVALGYRNSACPIVFEHGCPNNLPAILWANHANWKALFPNRSIPIEMRGLFGGENTDGAVEALWRVNQPKLALGVLDAISGAKPMDPEIWKMMTLLGLRARGVSVPDLASRAMITTRERRLLLDKCSRRGLYDLQSDLVTPLGAELLKRFRERIKPATKKQPIGNALSYHYPSQCEGERR